MSDHTNNDRATLVLVADDEADILDLTCLLLERAGYETVQAADGEEALRVVHERRPDVCVLDLLMPRMSGCAVLAALRADPETRELPVLLLTANVQQLDGKNGAAGADRHLNKPFRAQELVAQIAALVSERQRK